MLILSCSRSVKQCHALGIRPRPTSAASLVRETDPYSYQVPLLGKIPNDTLGCSGSQNNFRRYRAASGNENSGEEASHQSDSLRSSLNLFLTGQQIYLFRINH